VSPVSYSADAIEAAPWLIARSKTEVALGHELRNFSLEIVIRIDHPVEGAVEKSLPQTLKWLRSADLERLRPVAFEIAGPR